MIADRLPDLDNANVGKYYLCDNFKHARMLGRAFFVFLHAHTDFCSIGSTQYDEAAAYPILF